MCKQSANSATIWGIKAQARFFSIAEKAEDIALAQIKKLGWMPLIIWFDPELGFFLSNVSIFNLGI